MPIYNFTERELRLIKETIGWVRRFRQRNPRSIEEDLPSNTLHYVALTPVAGIPGLTEHYAHGETGTGSGTADAGPRDRPGMAVCEIYRSIRRTDGKHELRSVGMVKEVLNLSPCKIPGQRWCLIEEDAYGNWYADYRDCSLAPGIYVGTGTGTGTGTHAGGGGTSVQTACCPAPIPSRLYAHLHTCSGALAPYDGAILTLDYGAVPGYPTSWGHTSVLCVTSPSALYHYLTLKCDGVWILNYGSFSSFTNASACSPFFLNFAINGGSSNCNGACATVIITETA